jgi:hypothetical protein
MEFGNWSVRRWDLLQAGRLEFVGVHLTHVINSRVWDTWWLWLCVVAWVFLSKTHRNRLRTTNSTVSWIEEAVLSLISRRWRLRMTNPRNRSRRSTLVVVMFPILSLLASAQDKKEFSYTVGPRAVISITNHYGPTTIKPSGNRQVVITIVSYSEAVSFENEQHGNRIELRSISPYEGSGLVDYTVLVPGDALVSVRSTSGTVHAQGLRGDLILQAETAMVEVSDVSDAHLSVNTLSGPINLMNIRNSHLDVRSVSGDVTLHNATGSSVEVNSAHGRINYDGDPGPAGEFRLMSHSGDLDISIPTSASVEITSHSINGKSDKYLRDGASARSSGNLFLKPTITNASRFVLRSFKGNIRVSRP